MGAAVTHKLAELKTGAPDRTFFTHHINLDINVSSSIICHYCRCDEKGPFWYHVGAGGLGGTENEVEWRSATSLKDIFEDLQKHLKEPTPRLWICAKVYSPCR